MRHRKIFPFSSRIWGKVKTTNNSYFGTEIAQSNLVGKFLSLIFWLHFYLEKYSNFGRTSYHVEWNCAWSSIANKTFSFFPSRQSGERAEQTSVFAFKPLRNVLPRRCFVRNFFLRFTVRPGVAQENNKMYILTFVCDTFSPSCPMPSRRSNASYLSSIWWIQTLHIALLRSRPWTWNSSSGKWVWRWSLRRSGLRIYPYRRTYQIPAKQLNWNEKNYFPISIRSLMLLRCLNWTIIIVSRLDSISLSLPVVPLYILYLLINWMPHSYTRAGWGNSGDYFLHSKKRKHHRQRVCKIGSNTAAQNLELEIFSVFPDV